MYFRDLVDKARRFSHRERSSGALRASRRRRLLVEQLESRTLLSGLGAVPTGLVDVITNNRANTLPVTESAFETDLQAAISNPSISGIAFQIDWKDIEPTMPSNPLMPSASDLDQKTLARLNLLFTDAARPEPGYPQGKWVQLLIFPGFWSPKWITGTVTVTNTGTVIVPSPVGVATVPFNVQYGQQDHGDLLPLPLPWDPTYLADWSAFLGLVSQMYGNCSAFRMIAAAGPTSVSDEFTEPDQNKGTLDDTAKWMSVHYLPATYDAAWQTMFGVYKADFPNQYVSLSAGQGVYTINADGSPAKRAQKNAANAAATRTALLEEGSSTLAPGQFVYQSSSLTGDPAAQPALTQASQTSLISENGDIITGFQLGSSAEDAPTKQGAPGNPALALALSIEYGMRLNPTNGQHVDYIEVQAPDVDAAEDGTSPAMQTVLNWAATLFDAGTLSLFDQTAEGNAITVSTDSQGDLEVTGDVVSATNVNTAIFYPGQITSINIYPEIYVENSPTTTADADNTVSDTNVPVTIATDIPGTTYDGVPGVIPGVLGFNPSHDDVTIGGDSSDGAQGIEAPVTVAYSSPSTRLTIDDSADKAAGFVTMSADGILGLSPALIEFYGSNIDALTVDGGSGGWIYQINSTRVPTTINGGAGDDTFVTAGVLNADFGNITGALTLNGGAGANNLTVNDQDDLGNDTYTVAAGSIQRTSSAGVTFSNIGAVFIEGGGGNDTYNVDSTAAVTPVTINVAPGVATGNNTFNVSPDDKDLDDIAGLLTVNAVGGGANTLNLDDRQNARADETYTVTSAAVTRAGTAGVAFSGMQDIVLNGGGGGNTIHVESTAAGTSTTVNAGSGNDTINVGKADNLNDILGPLTVHGQGGMDTLNINDRSAVRPQTYTLTASTLTRSNPVTSPVTITFGTSLSLVVNGSSGGNAFVVTAPPPVKVTLKGGGGTNSLTGPDVPNTWTINGPNAGNLQSNSGSKIDFTAVASLVGGSAGNDFVFRTDTDTGVSGALSGALDGGAGLDNELDYSAYHNSVFVNMLGGVATGTGGITNIQDVLGSGQGDVLVGDGTGVELVETAGRNLMIGGSGGGATLQSGDGQDIVIAGSTNYDDKHDALAAIEAYWSNTANGTFTQRADALSAGIPGGYVLDSFTVLTHSRTGDTIALGSADDWLFWNDTVDTLVEGTPKKETSI